MDIITHDHRSAIRSMEILKHQNVSKTLFVNTSLLPMGFHAIFHPLKGLQMLGADPVGQGGSSVNLNGIPGI